MHRFWILQLPNVAHLFVCSIQPGHRKEWVHQILRREHGRSGLDPDWKSELHCAPDQQSNIARQSSIKAFDLLRIGV